MLAIGGISRAGRESSVEVLGPDRQAWTTGPQLPFKISGAVTIHGPQGEIILVGGIKVMSGFSTVILWPPNSTRFSSLLKSANCPYKLLFQNLKFKMLFGLLLKHTLGFISF